MLVTDLDASVKTATHQPPKPNMLTLAQGSWALEINSSTTAPIQGGDRCRMRNWKLVQLASLSYFEVPPNDKWINER